MSDYEWLSGFFDVLRHFRQYSATRDPVNPQAWFTTHRQTYGFIFGYGKTAVSISNDNVIKTNGDVKVVNYRCFFVGKDILDLTFKLLCNAVQKVSLPQISARLSYTLKLRPHGLKHDPPKFVSLLENLCPSSQIFKAFEG